MPSFAALPAHQFSAVVAYLASLRSSVDVIRITNAGLGPTISGAASCHFVMGETPSAAVLRQIRQLCRAALRRHRRP